MGRGTEIHELVVECFTNLWLNGCVPLSSSLVFRFPLPHSFSNMRILGQIIRVRGRITWRTLLTRKLRGNRTEFEMRTLARDRTQARHTTTPLSICRLQVEGRARRARPAPTERVAPLSNPRTLHNLARPLAPVSNPRTLRNLARDRTQAQPTTTPMPPCRQRMEGRTRGI